MKECGLVRGENGLELYVMCEIPSNVISADAFAYIFDGFSRERNLKSAKISLNNARHSEIESENGLKRSIQIAYFDIEQQKQDEIKIKTKRKCQDKR